LPDAQLERLVTVIRDVLGEGAGNGHPPA
jgi:hypothetical protein